MKKLILTLLAGLFISFLVTAQNFAVNIHGTVTMVYQNSVFPVPNQQVMIIIDSTNFGFTYQNTVITDESGYYEDYVEMPGFNGFAMVQTMTYDTCLGYYQYNYQTVVPGATLAPMDFILCDNIPIGCQASFYYFQSNPTDPYTFSFYNSSIGNYTEVLWSFGDSTFSTEINPVHTFSGPGTYNVCLTISDGLECNSTYCDFVFTGGGNTGCENYFYYYSTNDPYTLTFEGFMMNGQYAQYYSWDFGDGTYGSGQTVTHTYNPQGIAMYLVGLTTIVMDSTGMDSCFYTSYQEVWLQNDPGCNAYFSYFSDPANPATINFIDMSYDPNGWPPSAWYWEFGDGTSSTEQNPIHTYADTGYYTVCLTISALDSCTSTYCEEIFTGNINPVGCESWIIPMNLYGLTVDFEGYTVSQYETQYTWEFGDGVTGTGQFVSHTYPSAGMYNVTLQTVDASGCYYQTFTQIWLDSANQGGCNAMFNYEQADSTTFTFFGYIYFNNGGIYPDSSAVYSWDFGDGTAGSGQTVTHYFQSNPAGGYNVCLTATTVQADGTTCTATYCEYVSLVIPGFNIFGHVYLENNMVADQAMVHLMSMDSTWSGVVEVQSMPIDSMGFYSFNNVPFNNARLYFVQAELMESSAFYGQYVPTYHLNALNWEGASPILPLNNWPADVFMIAGNTVDGGNGSITGVVSNLGTRGYLNDVEVVLLDGENNPLKYTRSNEQGEFIFESLALGTYGIHAELMGIHTILGQVTLSEQQPEAIVEVQVSGGEANVVFGINDELVSFDKVSEIYPNPAKDHAWIEVSVNRNTTIELNVIGLTGQSVEMKELTLGTGNHNIDLDLGSMPKGIYMVRIHNDKGDLVIRKLIKY